MRGYSSLALTPPRLARIVELRIRGSVSPSFARGFWQNFRPVAPFRASNPTTRRRFALLPASNGARLTLSSYGPIVAIRKIVVKWSYLLSARVDKNNTLPEPEDDSSTVPFVLAERTMLEARATQEYLKNAATNVTHYEAKEKRNRLRLTFEKYMRREINTVQDII